MAKQKRRGTAASSSDRISAEAAAARLLALDGTPRTLAQLWKDRPVVLVFLRHFG